MLFMKDSESTSNQSENEKKVATPGPRTHPQDQKTLKRQREVHQTTVTLQLRPRNSLSPTAAPDNTLRVHTNLLPKLSIYPFHGMAPTPIHVLRFPKSITRPHPRHLPLL
ncbi:hypothetical protein QTJ16_006381 [Diplocarpon rosae]|uniref:Uncharacterized protein n=1 Tax=Diplocarpon rosae TaxID=946125 RepID=A0AAD9SVP2_9HELO|nr:hypothetical protein QTJ16_006381 [Diplocarpon rosae]